jgi:glycosyltransferase involved in cell wall biosynthesis
VKQKQLKISVIVPVYNGEYFLNHCLDALLNSNYSLFEIIVVDDCSTDKSAEISRAKGAKVLTMSRNSGPAAARNFAAENVDGDILLFVDADVVVKRDTLSKVVESFNQNPDISALFGSYDDSPKEQNFLSQYKNLQHHFVHQTSNPEASTFWAGLGAIRREVFIKIGGFDCERFAIPSIEDIELGVRLRSAGYKILLNREIQAKHLKKWKFIGLIKTEVFCRAMPWSKLILTNQGMINDMNLKTNDRLSAGFVALSLAVIPLVFWKPLLIILLLAFLLIIIFLNRNIFKFFYRKKGLFFAVFTFPWLFFYFFYSASTFLFCWFRYALPLILGFGKKQSVSQI